jgi:hypothetical protein
MDLGGLISGGVAEASHGHDGIRTTKVSRGRLHRIDICTGDLLDHFGGIVDGLAIIWLSLA